MDSTGVISTIAGNGTDGYSGDGGPATSASFSCPDGLLLWAGSIYVADNGNSVVRRIDPNGIVSTIPGTLNRPNEMSIDASGALLIASVNDQEVREAFLGPNLLTLSVGGPPPAVAFGQTMTYNLTVGNPGGAGTATGVSLSDPLPSGTTFVSASASSGTCSLSGSVVGCSLGQLPPGGATTATITVTAPTTGSSLSNTASVSAVQSDPTPADNTVTATTVLGAADVSVTGSGSPAQVVAGALATHIFSVSSGGSIATGVTLSATLTQNSAIQSVSTTQGSCTPSGSAVTCSLGTIGVGVTTTVIIATEAPPTVGTITDTATITATTPDPNSSNNTATVQTTVSNAFGVISSIAGAGTGGDGGPAVTASLIVPLGVAEDAAGNIYIAEQARNRIRKIDVSGIITSYAGDTQSQPGYSGDGGPASSARLNGPNWLSFDAAGDLLVDDNGNNVIRSINPTTGIITTVAGTSTAGYTGDGGPAVSAELNNPQSVRGLPGGGFLIGDLGNNVIRKVDASGTIRTIVGNGTAGYAGDGGSATSAELNSPQDVAIDAAGSLIIADCGNEVIRKVDTSGTISTIAGTGAAGYSGDGGPATSATFSCPNGLALSGANIYVSDYGNNVVRRIDPSGTITTIAGDGSGNCCGDPNGDGGPATSAAIGRANQIWLDPAGNMLIADVLGDRIREVTKVAPDLINVTPGPAPLIVGAGQQYSVSLFVSNPGTDGLATGVSLSDPLPSGATFVSATTTQGACSAPSGAVTCAIVSFRPVHPTWSRSR